MAKLFAYIKYDAENDCWWVAHSNIPGLCASMDTLEGLLLELDWLVPYLGYYNKADLGGRKGKIPYEIRIVRQSESLEEVIKEMEGADVG